MSDAIRIAIHAFEAEAADALFDAVAERAQRKQSLSMRRADTGEADVSLYSMRPGAAVPESEIAADPAKLKFLLAPAADAAALARIEGIVVLALEEGDDVLRQQARAVVKGLKDNAAGLALSMRIDRAAKKEAKHAAKAARRSEKKSGKSTAAPVVEAAAPSSVDRAAKKEAKHAAKAAKRGEKKGGKAVVTPAAPAPDLPVDRAAKKEAKHAAKAAKRGEKKSEKAATEPAVAPAVDRAAKKAAKRAAKEAKREDKAPTPQAAAQTVGARDGKKDAKRAAKLAKRGEKKSGKNADAPKPDRDGKKDAKRAAKEAKRSAAGSDAPAVAADAASAAKDREAKKESKRALKKQKRTEQKAAKPGTAPGLDATKEHNEERLARRAEKKEKRATGQGAADAAPDIAPSAEEIEAKAKQVERALKRKKRSEEKAALKAVPGAEVLLQEGNEKEAKRALKKQKRFEKQGASGDTPTDRAAKKNAKRAAKGKPPKDPSEKKDKKDKTPKDRSANKEDKRKVREGRIAAHKLAKEQGIEEPLETGYEYRFSGLGEPAASALAAALQAVFQNAGATLNETRGRADFALYAFDDPALGPNEIRAQAKAIAEADHRRPIFLERTGEGTEEANRAIAELAALNGAPLVTLSSLLARHGVASGSAESYVLAANAILGVCAAGRVPRHGAARVAGPVPPDLAEARAAAAAPSKFLEQGWSEAAPPKLIRSGPKQDEVEAFLDSKFLLPSEETRDFSLPIDWAMALPDRRSRFFLYGLEFLQAPLMYWYGKANGQKSEQYAATTAALKQRNAVPAQILTRAGEIIGDFARKHPLSAMSEAWDEKAVARRAPVLAAYALCCRAAVRRKIRFDEGLATGALLSLFDAIELLRADDFYEPRSIQGVRQDCLLVGLGLALRKTAYGERVIADALARLKKLQLDLGLTPEGVWRDGGFGAHCQVLSEISTLLVDMGASDVLAPVAGDAKKMTVFVEALVKNNGYPLPIDVTKPKSYAETLSAARRALAGIGLASAKVAAGDRSTLRPRIMETYVFREAQYFVSVTSQKVSVEGSQVVLHADRAAPMNDDPGGLSLAFAFGARDLVVRALPSEKPKSKGSRGTLYDPAMRGGYRIDGEGYVGADAVGARGARIVKSWRGSGWAAARCTDDLYAKGTLGRTVVHLKAQHALIVIDEVAALSGEASFEQSWHVAADLDRPEAGAALRFGGLAASVDRGEVALHAGPPGFVRRLRLAKGVLATLFQWTDDPAAAPPAVTVVEEGEAWTVTASGAGFSAKLLHRGGEMLVEIDAGAPA
jgi:hypothetical protein